LNEIFDFKNWITLDYNKPTFCLIGPTFPFKGGIAHYTTLLFRHLKKIGNVKFYSFKKQYPSFLFPGKTDIDISKKPLFEKGVEPKLNAFNPLSWIILGFKISKLNPDLVIFPWWIYYWAPHYIVIIVLVKVFSKKTKVLFLCHNIVGHESSFLGSTINRIVLKLGNYFIVHSEDEGKALSKIKPRSKISVTYHPIYDVFFENRVDVQFAREKLHLDGNVILFFGFVREYKGLNYLLNAMPTILKHITVRLMIAGEFWQDKKVYIDMIQRLKLHTFVVIHDQYIPNEEIPKYFASANVLVAPYRSVTGSGIIQMAFGAGLPVITTNVGNLNKIVDEGVTGYIVQPEDSNALANAVIKYFKKHEELKFRKNIESVRFKYSWDNILDIIQSFINA
jgi:glycosyltransferase involved in cell wall biosynthesis